MAAPPLNLYSVSCGLSDCNEPITVYQARQCSYCDRKELNDSDPYYHITCKVKGCRKEYCKEHDTCWTYHLPRSNNEAKKHEPLDLFPQVFVQGVIHSEKSTNVLRELHAENERARWFKIRRELDETPYLYVYDRFSRLCDPERSGNHATATTYPSFVSFIGDTSMGKSTIVKAMILMGRVNSLGLNQSSRQVPDKQRVGKLLSILEEGKYGPVTRSGRTDHLTDPTTLGVCLYSDDCGRETSKMETDPGTPRYQMLFADCEGFGAKTEKSNAQRMESDLPSEDQVESRGRNILSPTANGNGWRSRSTSRISRVCKNEISKERVTADCYGKDGKDGVDLFYARYLYAVSDVIVFVTKEDQKMHAELLRVLEWACAAVNKSVNHPSRKTLIIARNMSEHHDPGLYDSRALEDLYLESDRNLWKDSPILKEFVDKYNAAEERFAHRISRNKDLYNALFHSITCFYIPHARNVKGNRQLFDQYVALRKEIDRASMEGLHLRSKGFMQYNVPALGRILSRAFSHFRTMETPFDFFEAARLATPNPASLPEHLANFLQHAYGDYKGDRRKLDEMILDTFVVSLVLFAHRSFDHAPLPDEVFTRHFKVDCLESIKMYRQRYQRCNFMFKGGRQCIVRPIRHIQHATRDGEFIPGAFVGDITWDEDHRSTWINKLQRKFDEIYVRFFTRDDRALHGTELDRSIRNGRKAISKLHSNIWSSVKSNQSCFSCVQAVPDHVLTCGHAFCPQCIQELGRESGLYESSWIMDSCFLCFDSLQDKPHLIRLKPRCAGVRLLTLDGGGIRGIVELYILRAIWEELDLRIPMRELFDLIVGTSTGGIIALALALADKPVDQQLQNMVDFFKDAAKKTFEQSRAGCILAKFDANHLTAKFFMLLRFNESVFDVGPLKEALMTYFGHETVLFAPGLHKNLQANTRVAVTAAKDHGTTDCLIASYNRPKFDHTCKTFEREDSLQDDMLVWEAGLATAAAPFWLPPFCKTTSSTEYVDGAVYANCPAQVAFQEISKLWPGDGARLDILLSLGTGLQTRQMDKIPSAVRFGGFVAMRAMFERQLDSTKNWDKFYDSVSNPTTRCRLKRLNPELHGKYVALHEFQRMPELKSITTAWALGPGRSQIQSIARMLTASLFFFEPEGPCAVHENYPGPDTEYLCGSIRCRLAHESPALTKVLGEKAGSFWYTEAERPDNDNVWKLPDGHWDRISTGGKSLAQELVQDENHQKVKFRLKFCFVVPRLSTKHQIIAVQLKNGKERLPISGFPAQLGSLHERANQKWLQ